MSRRRRRSSNDQNSRRSHAEKLTAADNNSTDVPPPRWLSMLVGVFLVVRYFLPAESAPLGETLWVVQFWLIGAVVWFWLTARAEGRLRPLDQLDLAVGLLVGGHVLAAALVLVGEGDRRAALNMLWEWIGIGVATLMIRDVVRTPRGRSELLTLVILSAITLSGLGLWQHHVWYPSLVETFAEYEQVLSTPPTDGQSLQQREKRLQSLREELGPLAATGDTSMGQLYRSRVAASTEPIGRFALANTFAGLLLVALLLAVAQLFAARASGFVNWHWWGGGLLMIGTTYCFWLTKSRTAYVGLLAGLGVWFLLARRRGRTGGGVWRAVIVATALLVLLPVMASLSGSLDRQVITEAPKSLQYRLEYWTATGAVIRQSPWFGVGPGNFRQAYLAHKLPGSSEEILDPHNLLLDVWANGGLLALAGLLWLAVLVLRRGWRSAGELSAPQRLGEGAMMSPQVMPARSVIYDLIAGAVALGLAAFVSLMSGSGLMMDWWWLLAGWFVVSLIWPVRSRITVTAMTAAVVALLVHLLGAGGIAMPAILQTLLLLACCLLAPESKAGERVQHDDWSALPPPLPWQPMLAAGCCLCLAVACALTSTLPVSMSRTQTALGRAIRSQGGRADEAMRAFEAAIEADPLAADPWQELALAHAGSWQQLAGRDSSSFDTAIKAQQEAIRLDPQASARWQLLGELWWMRYQQTVNLEAANQARAAFEQATARYPHLATLQARLAEAAAACGAGQPARSAARQALILDEANRRFGHVDKFLPEEVRQAMEAITGGPASSD